jgi:hypothetical protein
MFITQMSLPRRTFLRGVGATIALPLIEAMIPALTAEAATAANVPKRFAAIYIPHGAMLDQWLPRTTGRDFAFSPTLKPLESFRDQLCVISGLDGPLEPTGGGGHAIGPASWLSGVAPKTTQGADVYAGTTLDQVLARQIGQDTPLPSLELGTEDFSRFVGACEIFYSCTYVNTVSWRTPTTPLPVEINPRVVFDRIFGGGGTAAERAARIQEDRSILDSVAEGTKRLERGLGPGDRARLGDYFESIREIERRIQKAERHGDAQIAMPSAPIGAPDGFEDRVALMFDMLALAFQADVTRVSTFMMARDYSQQTYPQLGVPDPNHLLSHHGDNPEKMAKLAVVNRHHYTLFAKFLETLRSTPDGNGSLLDHSAILYGSGMSNPNRHSHVALPLVLAGGGFKGGRHLAHRPETPVGNLHLTLAAKFGLEMERFGDSTGTIDL